MKPAFAGRPVGEAILLLTLGVWFVLEVRQGFHRRLGATSTDRNSLVVVQLFAAAGVVLAALSIRVPAAAFPSSSVILGVSLGAAWAGIGLRLWSFRTLGRYFTFTVMTSVDQPVITSGPYRWLRHPSYTGILLILGGIGVSFGNWLSFAALTLVPLAGFVYRIRVEEAALSKTLGSAYVTYAAGRKRIIPFVW